MTATPPTVTRTAIPPTAAGGDLWEGVDLGREQPPRPNSNGGGRRGGGRAQLPPPMPLADRKRTPTGRQDHPVVLLSGGHHSGKSYLAALASADDRLGPMYWFQIGRETTADSYGAIPGATYSIIGHDGTWRDIMAALEQSHAEAHATVAAAGYDFRPPVLTVDTVSGEWALLSAWAERRATSSNAGVETLLADPHADVDIGALIWTAARRRHNAFMQLVLTWPGPVFLLARGRMALAINPKTKKPDYTGPKEYLVESQHDLPFETTIHVRLAVGEHPTVLSYRHPTHPIGGRFGRDPQVIDPRSEKYLGVEFGLPWLLFGPMRYDPRTASVREVLDVDPVSDDLTAAEMPTPPAKTVRPVLVDPDADEVPGKPVAAETTPQGGRDAR